MKKMIVVLMICCRLTPSSAQETGERFLQTESMLKEDDTETEDDTYWQQMDYLRKHQLNINKASADELAELNIISDIQLQYLIRYRTALGALISIYELQAVPGWDIATIQKLVPYITVTGDGFPIPALPVCIREGDHSLLMRYSRVVEKAKGYKEPGRTYLGSPDKMLLRYRFNYKSRLQWGILADKDAGELFFAGRQRYGFDFYSFHFCLSTPSLVRTLVVGDFTVNMGQGLISWQGMSTGRSGESLSIKKQSATLHAYTSAGEYNFHRGAGITLQRRRWETTFFIAAKKQDANLVADSTRGNEYVSSFPVSGYHRTQSENADKATVLQRSIGTNVRYRSTAFNIGINAVWYTFSKPVQAADEPYNLFAIHGAATGNASIDYSYTYRNLHLFGEAAVDNNNGTAFIGGALIALNQAMDLAFVYRSIEKEYRSMYGSAFTENTRPVNEEGLYTGISVRPSRGFMINAYTDVFRFPWLRFRADAPGTGAAYLIKVAYNPNKQSELIIWYGNKTKPANSDADLPTRMVTDFARESFRLQCRISVGRSVILQHRAELVWYNEKAGSAGSHGFLGYVDGFYKHDHNKWSGNIRLQYFEADSYDSRLYVFESDVLYGFSIPAFSNAGFRYYINLNMDILNRKNKDTRIKVELWVKWAQTIYNQNVSSIGTGADEITGRKRSEIKIQLITKW
jgi:hypothetical protein